VSKDQTPSPAPAPHILETDSVRDALERLCDGLGAREPFLIVTGEAGTGKTTLVRAAIERWGERATVAFVADPAMSRTELLEEIVRRFGGEPPAGASKPQLIASLEAAIRAAKQDGRVPVVVIDDAHEIPAELLGELRLLGNVSAQAGGPLEIVLVGLPALEARLADPALEALRQRVAAHVVTAPLSSHQARRFVHEVAAAGEKDPQSLFPKKACRELHAWSGGVPRTLGTLAAEALRLARRADDAAVTPAHVAEAAAEMGLSLRAGADGGAAPAARFATGAAPRTDGGARAAAPQARPAGNPAPSGPRQTGAGAAPVERRSADRPHAPRPAGDPQDELKPPGDPKKVSDWVGKFISPEEPRFGDLIGTSQLAAFADADSGFGADTEPIPDELLAKLRRRRGRVLPRYRRGRRRQPEWLGTAALILVIIAALVTIAGPAKRMVAAGLSAMSAAAERSEEERAARAAAEAAADSLAAAGAAEEAQKPAPAKREKPAPSRTKRRSEPAQPEPVRQKPAPPEPYVPPAGRVPSIAVPAAQTKPDQLWALDVGTHPDAGMAGMDRERLVEATGLKGWLVRAANGYRVVLGSYSTRERAERGANLLLGGNLVEQAAVIPLPPRSVRQ